MDNTQKNHVNSETNWKQYALRIKADSIFVSKYANNKGNMFCIGSKY